MWSSNQNRLVMKREEMKRRRHGEGQTGKVRLAKARDIQITHSTQVLPERKREGKERKTRSRLAGGFCSPDLFTKLRSRYQNEGFFPLRNRFFLAYLLPAAAHLPRRTAPPAGGEDRPSVSLRCSAAAGNKGFSLHSISTSALSCGRKEAYGSEPSLGKGSSKGLGEGERERAHKRAGR